MANKMDRAIENYKHWNKKDPDAVIKSKYNFPEHLYKVGKAVQIYYYSDKWAEDGNGCTYYHDFTSTPSLYVSESSKVLASIKHKAALKPHATKSLTGITNLNGNVSLPVLATLQQLTIDFGTYKRRINFKSENPFVTCSDDRKSVIILAKSGVIVVRGGKMRVTERGIVN